MIKTNPPIFTTEQHRQTRSYTSRYQKVLEELLILILSDTYLEPIPKTTAIIRYSIELENKPDLLKRFIEIAGVLGIEPKDLMQDKFDKHIEMAVVNALKKTRYKVKPMVDADGIIRKIKLI